MRTFVTDWQTDGLTSKDGDDPRNAMFDNLESDEWACYNDKDDNYI